MQRATFRFRAAGVHEACHSEEPPHRTKLCCLFSYVEASRDYHLIPLHQKSYREVTQSHLRLPAVCMLEPLPLPSAQQLPLPLTRLLPAAAVAAGAVASLLRPPVKLPSMLARRLEASWLADAPLLLGSQGTRSSKKLVTCVQCYQQPARLAIKSLAC